MFSCGTKATTNKTLKAPDEVEEFLKYSSSVIGDKSLMQKKFKGALTDEKGFEDVGAFEYSTYYDFKKRELVRISNLEITDKKVLENYYFEDNELVYIQIIDPHVETRKLGDTLSVKLIIANDKARESEKNKIYFNKAKLFKEAFYKSEKH